MAMSTSTAARVVQVARRIVEQLTQGNTQPDYLWTRRRPGRAREPLASGGSKADPQYAL